MSTAAAIDLLQKQKIELQGTSKSLNVDVDSHRLSVSDDLLDGKTMDYISISSVPNRIMMSAADTETTGNLTWYYFARPVQQDNLNKALEIEKTLYVFRKEQGWQMINSSTVLNSAERVQVRLKVRSATNLKFVHVKDIRAAAFEPQNVKSGYEYTDKVSYYQAIKDTGMEIFVEMLPRGITEFRYDLVVAQGGTFHSGPAILQSMYKPGLTAYSGVSVIKVD